MKYSPGTNESYFPEKLFVDRKTVVLGSIGKDLSEYIRKYCN